MPRNDVQITPTHGQSYYNHFRPDEGCKILQYSHHCMLMGAFVYQGFRRIYDDMTEIVLDIPNGYVFLSKLVDKGELHGFLPQEIVNELPQR